MQVTYPEELSLQFEAERCRRSLKRFVTEAWHVIEPGTEFIDNWHIDAICEHLEAVTFGDIRDLVINIPPRMSKSIIVSIMWPVWHWTFEPNSRWLFSSYADSLATDHAVKSRRIIQSNWYQQRFGHVFKLTSDQNVKTYYENDKTGYRIATSVGGSATGRGGDFVISDDSHNVKEAESEAKRTDTVRWWAEVMSTRRNDPQRSARVVIMQRVHQEDVTNWCIEHDFEHLCIPMRYEGENRSNTSLGFTDPRKKEDELLCPERFGEEATRKLELDLGQYGTASQLQQRPTPRSGGMFQLEYFETTDVHLPEGAGKIVRYWDKAGSKEETAKYTAGVRMRILNGVYYVEDVVRGRWEAPERERVIKETAKRDRDECGHVTIWVEQEPGSGGKESAHATVKNLAGFVCYPDKPTGDKFARAEPLAAQFAVGNVKLKEGKWNQAYIDELVAAGPGAKYLDQMDASAGAFNKLLANEYGTATGLGKLNEDLEQENPWKV